MRAGSGGRRKPKKGGLASVASGPPTAPPLGPDPLPSYRVSVLFVGWYAEHHAHTEYVCVRDATVYGKRANKQAAAFIGR